MKLKFITFSGFDDSEPILNHTIYSRFGLGEEKKFFLLKRNVL